MNKSRQRIVAVFLLLVNLTQVFAAITPSEKARQINQVSHASLPNALNPNHSDIVPFLDSFAFTTEQLGLAGPFAGWATYSNLTGLFFSGQYLKKFTDFAAIGLLGEYGSKQYRFNGTLGFNLSARTLLKFTVERFNQKLPFSFESGNLEKRVGQNAFGARLQTSLNKWINNINVGGYYSNAENVHLNPLLFETNGSNCVGAQAGLLCSLERNIAGGTSAGVDIGAGAFVTPMSTLEAKVYYDSLRYKTIFDAHSTHNTSGLGWGLKAQQLVLSNIKISAGAQVRKIYNTYDIALAWLPKLTTAAGTELALTLQRVISHNPTPSNDSVGVRFTMLTDKANYEEKIYKLATKNSQSDIGVWVKQPAVKMNQVLAIAEQVTHLVAPTITSITPSNGPITGGNTVVINGRNFPNNALVMFGGQIAAVVGVSLNSITVVAPAVSTEGFVDLTITTPDNQTSRLSKGYQYGNASALPVLFRISPAYGNTSGVLGVRIFGNNFVPGNSLKASTPNTTINFGGKTITPISVTKTELLFNAPPNPAGAVNIRVDTINGNTGMMMAGFEYMDAPTIVSVTPDAIPTSGFNAVEVRGSGFVPNETTISFNHSTTIIPTVTDSNTLHFNAPPHSVGPVSITISTPAGTTTEHIFNYQAPPTITGLSATAANINGMIGITITGTNFVPQATSVTIGNQTLVARNITTTSLVFDAPSHPAGPVIITVTTSAGTSSSFTGFHYSDAPSITSLSPNVISTLGSASVIINGSGFSSNSTVSVDGATVPITSFTDSAITFASPIKSGGTYMVRVNSAVGSSGEIGLTYVDAPTVTTINPAVSPITGSAGVVVHGSHFVPGSTTVNFDGVSIVPFNVNATSLSFNAPAHAPGQVSVSITTPGGTSADVQSGFNYVDGPIITAISPQVLSSSTGQNGVIITGSGFVAGTVIHFDGATIVPIITPTTLRFDMPAHSAGRFPLTVTTSAGTSAPIEITYTDAPTTSTAQPYYIPLSGQENVTLSGTGFTADAALTVDGQAVTITSISPTAITFNAPASSAGVKSVQVTTTGGSSTVSRGLNYIAAPSVSSLTPNNGALSGGATVVVEGSGFVEQNTAVYFDGTLITPTSVTQTTVSFIVPSQSSAGVSSVSISTPGGTSGAINGGYTYFAAPNVHAITPNYGNISGTSSVAITGNNFAVGNTVVTVDGVAVTPSSVTTTEILLNMPSRASAGQVNVTVTTPGGTSSTLVFDYVSIPTIAAISPTTGNIAGGTTVTLEGSGFIENTLVSVDGVSITPTLIDTSTLRFVTPAHSAGAVQVIVSTSNGNSAPVTFTYTVAPTISQISPQTLSINGQVNAVITGSGFVNGDTTVTIDGAPQALTLVSSTTISLDLPAHSAGTVPVVIRVAAQQVSTTVRYVAQPVASAITPSVASVNGVSNVVLTGAHFVANATTVIFDGVDIIPTVLSDDRLQFNAPSHSAGTVTVMVRTVGGTSASPGLNFAYSAAPTVATLSTTFVSVDGHIGLTINGTGFIDGNTTIYLDGVASGASITALTSTEITVNLPAHAAGEVLLTVVTSAGASAPIAIHYLGAPTADAISTAYIPLSGMSGITITGTNFSPGSTQVSVDGVLINATNISSTSKCN